MALCVSSVEAEFKDQVSPPFVSGVQKLEDFLEVLQGEAVHSLSTTAKVDKVASKLRPYVTQAYVKFSAAHKKADEINARICREIEEGVAQQHQIECDIRKKEEEESSLSNRVNTIRDNVRDTEKQVNDARSDLSAAESTLSSARDNLEEKKQEQKTVAIVGAVITPIPIIGWIAGPTMIVVSLTALEDAVNCADNAVGSARGNVRTREERLNNKKQELRDLEEELSAKKRQREDKQRELERQQKDLKEKKETQKQVLNLSEKLKYFATFIATTLGRTKVLQGEFKTIYTLETLEGPLRAIAEHFQSPKLGNSRLLSGEMDFTSSGKKFQMICDKTSIKMITNTEDWA